MIRRQDSDRKHLYPQVGNRRGFHQGGCFLYYEGETLRDYCYRNGEPYPVRRIPEEVIEMFESGDFSQIRKWRRKVPELKGLRL